jgi:hypothetical protein
MPEAIEHYQEIATFLIERDSELRRFQNAYERASRIEQNLPQPTATVGRIGVGDSLQIHRGL